MYGGVCSHRLLKIKYKENKNMSRIKWDLKIAKAYCLENGSELLSDKFGKLKDKYTFLCTECKENTVVKTFDSYKVKNKAVCDNCSTKINWNIEKVKKYCIKNYSMFLSNEYKTINTKYDFKCTECGETFETTFSKFRYRNKRQCNKCNNHNIREYIEIKNEIELVGNILLTDELDYINTHQKLKIKCFKCENVFYRSFTEFATYKYKTCEICSMDSASKNRRYTNEYVSKYIRDKGATLLSPYTLATEKILLECKCGNVFETTFSDIKFFNKVRCNVCSMSKSNGELYFINFLKNNNIEFEYQKTFNNCKYKRLLPFDFYIKKHDILIEIDGIGHREFISFFHKTEENFKIRKIRDGIKTNYANENNLKLYRIEYNNIKDIKNWIQENKEAILNE